MQLTLLQELLNQGKIKWTGHSLEKMGERDISIAEVKACIMNGEVIEDYPDDYPFPSCLIFCMVSEGRVIHVCAGTDGETLYIITAYIPNTIKFEADLKTRRQ